MSRPVDIDARTTVLDIVLGLPTLLGAIGVLFGLALWLLSGRRADGFLCLWPSLAVTVIGVVVLMLVLRTRTITPRKNGFDFAHGGNKFFIRDDEVTAFTASSNVEHQLEGSASLLVEGLIEVRGEEFEGTIPLSYRYTHGGTDPLGGLCSRLVRRLAAGARTQADADGELIGDTWVLQADRLQYSDPSGERTVSVARITAVDVSDGVVRIWRTGVDEPFLRIPVSEPNASILAEVLGRRIAPAERPATTDRRRGSLGRMVYERNDSLPKTGILLGYIGAGVGAIFGVFQGYRVATGVHRQEATGVVLASLFVVGAAVGAYFLFRYSHWVLRCYEHGLSVERTGFRRDVRFAKVVWFRCEMIRQFLNGNYAGTDYTFRLKVRGEKEFKYTTREAKQDDALNGIRDHIARVLAEQSLERFRQGEPIPWGASMRFTAEGLELGSQKAGIHRSMAHAIPYDRLADVTIEKGVYQVFSRGERKPVRVGSIDERDFFPGLYLLAVLRRPSRTAGGHEQPSGETDSPSNVDDYRRKPRG